MRTLRALVFAFAGTIALLAECQQQYWNSLPGGNVINGNEYLGAAANSTVPLRFTTVPNLRHEWRTQNILRMRLLETNTTQNIGSYANQNISGNLGIGLFNTNNVTTPWSLLHLDCT